MGNADRTRLLALAKSKGWGMRNDDPFEDYLTLLWEEMDREDLKALAGQHPLLAHTPKRGAPDWFNSPGPDEGGAWADKGWRLMPVEASSHMMNQAVNAWHSWKSRDNGGNIQELARLMWEHMADVAPGPVGSDKPEDQPIPADPEAGCESDGGSVYECGSSPMCGCPAALEDPCPQCKPGGVCSALDCGRKRSSFFMQAYGTPSNECSLCKGTGVANLPDPWGGVRGTCPDCHGNGSRTAQGGV